MRHVSNPWDSQGGGVPSAASALPPLGFRDGSQSQLGTIPDLDPLTAAPPPGVAATPLDLSGSASVSQAITKPFGGASAVAAPAPAPLDLSALAGGMPGP